MVFQGILKGIFSWFQEYLKEGQREFQDLPRKFQGCSNKDFRVLQGSFKGILRKFLGHFNNSNNDNFEAI